NTDGSGAAPTGSKCVREPASIASKASGGVTRPLEDGFPKRGVQCQPLVLGALFEQRPDLVWKPHRARRRATRLEEPLRPSASDLDDEAASGDPPRIGVSLHPRRSEVHFGHLTQRPLRRPPLCPPIRLLHSVSSRAAWPVARRSASRDHGLARRRPREPPAGGRGKWLRGLWCSRWSLAPRYRPQRAGSADDRLRAPTASARGI